jgi:flagellar motor switch protein FliN
LAGEPELADSLPKTLAQGSFGFSAVIEGGEQGRFSVMLDAGLGEVPLLGEGADQRAGWAELVKETLEAAAGDLLARTGRKVQVTDYKSIDGESKLTRAFQLKTGDRTWPVLVLSEVRQPKQQDGPAKTPASARTPSAASGQGVVPSSKQESDRVAGQPTGQGGEGDLGKMHGLSVGLNLLLDVELEASLRFGSREMPLSEILDLGPGDVVQLDRHVSDPVDLIVGDKIVARGEVVLVNGNFGLRVTQVAEPQRRLESIRCLF